MRRSDMDRDLHPLILSIQHFFLPTMASPTLQGALKDGFGDGEAVVACDMPVSCKFPSLDSCQKRFLWAHKEVDFAPHSVVGLVFQVGDAEKFLQALVFEGLDPFFRVSKQGPCLTAMEENRGDKILAHLLVKLMVLLCQILFYCAIAAIAQAILMWISAA